jgi:hypothetical protein
VVFLKNHGSFPGKVDTLFYIEMPILNAQTSGIHQDPEVYLPGLAGVANQPGLI